MREMEGKRKTDKFMPSLVWVVENATKFPFLLEEGASAAIAI